jgi:sugar O-acyltransferase (sialic acid O-acetyltransferase NeuD family)
MKKTTKIVIIGGKGTAVNIAEGILDAQERYNENLEFLGFAFDDKSLGNSINGFPILCKTTDVLNKFGKYSDVKFIFQMHHQNKMKERASLINSMNIPFGKWFTFVHPSAYIARSVKVGIGSVIFANCAVHSNTIIGNHTTLCALTTIGHDTIIGNNVFMATHVCVGSEVEIGNYLFFGQNATIKNSVKIEENNIIGLGASVVQNITGNKRTFIGTPAKPMDKSLSS